MPLLSLNNWGIRVQQVPSKPEEIGSREVAVSGNELRTGTGAVNVITGRTAEYAFAEMSTLRSLLTGTSDRWGFVSDLWSDKGAAPSAGYVAPLRPLEGKFSLGAVGIEDSVTNLVPAARQDFSSWTQFSGAVVTLTQLQAIPGVTTNGGTRIQTTGGSATNKYFYDAGGSAGQAGAIAVWIYNTGAVPVVVGGNGVNTNTTVAVGQIKRVMAGTSSTIGTKHIDFMGQSAGVGLDFIAFQPMIVGRTFPGSFASTTSTAGALSLPASFDGIEGGFCGWVTPQQLAASIVDQNTSPALFSAGTYSTDGSLRLWAFAHSGAEPDLILFVRGAGASGWSLQQTVRASGTGWYTPGTPLHLGLAWTEGKYYTVYVNGTGFGPYTSPQALTSFAGGNYLQAGTAASSACGNAVYNDCWTFPCAPSAEYVAALATATARAATFPSLTVGGDTVNGYAKAYRGMVNGDIEAVQDTGGVKYLVPFRLREA